MKERAAFLRDLLADHDAGGVRKPEGIHPDLAELQRRKAATGEVVDRVREALALDDQEHLAVRGNTDALLAELGGDRAASPARPPVRVARTTMPAGRLGATAQQWCMRSPARQAQREPSERAFLYINVRQGERALVSARAQALPAPCVLPAALVDRLDHEGIRRHREDRSDDPVRGFLPLLESDREDDVFRGAPCITRVLAVRFDVVRAVLEGRLYRRFRRARATVVAETDHRVAVAPRQQRTRGECVLQNDIAAVAVGDLELQRELRRRLRRERGRELHLLACDRGRDGENERYSS